MEKILKGVLRFNAIGKKKFTAEMKRFQEALKPQSVFITCMDSRVLPSRFVDCEAGQMFIVRNAGNMVPHFRHYLEGNMVGTEGAGLELGVLVNDIQNVVVCGHSDCKAVNTLYDIRQDCNYLKYKNESLLKTWITLHGRKSIKTMYETMTYHPADSDDDQYQPLTLSVNIGNKDLTARIDPENNFNFQDKLSQLHCLQQASHFSTYPFLDARMREGTLKVFAMWFDVHKGDVYLFSPTLQKFVIINDESVDGMLKEVTSS